MHDHAEVRHVGGHVEEAEDATQRVGGDGRGEARVGLRQGESDEALRADVPAEGRWQRGKKEKRWRQEKGAQGPHTGKWGQLGRTDISNTQTTTATKPAHLRHIIIYPRATCKWWREARYIGDTCVLARLCVRANIPHASITL